MNPLQIAIVALRAAALAVGIVGNAKASQALLAVADAVQAGVNVDAHMAAVAEKLKAGTAVTDADWDDVLARIAADSDRLQSAG